MKYLIIIIITYLSFAFVKWDLNPSLWELTDRFLCVYVIILISILFKLIIMEKKEKKE